MAKDDININIKTNVKDASKGTEGLAKNTGKATTETHLLSGAMAKVKLAMGKVAATAKMMFATMKAGMISSGIGALVLAVIALFSYFTKTQRGAEMLERAMAGLGAVMDVITDLFSAAGEVMVGAFTDPQQAVKDLWAAIKKNIVNRVEGVIDLFGALGNIIKAVFSRDLDALKEAAGDAGTAMIQLGTGLDEVQQKKFADGIKNVVKEINEEAAAAMRLKGIMQNVRREEMKFSKVQAQTRQEVAKARLLAMDESLSQEKRLKAINEVREKEMEMTRGLIALQQKKVNAQREVVALGNSMIEDEEELMALEVELINLTTQSTMTQKRLMTEVEALNIEIAVKKKAREKLEADARKQIELEKLEMTTTLQGEELEAAQKLADDKLASFKNLKDEEIKLEGESAKERIKLLKKVAKQDAALEKLKETEKQKTIKMGFAAAKGLAKEGSDIAKGIAVAETIWNTQQAIMAAMKIPYPMNIIQSVLTGVMGAQAVAKILSTSPSSSSSGGGAGATASATPRTTVASGAFTLGEGLEPEPQRAFVVSDDITNSQNALANIRRRATI